MSDPIRSVTHRDLSWPDLPSDRDDFRETIEHRADERTYGACEHPATVIGAALCDNQDAVSRACRRAAPGTIDEYLCDDRALQKVQSFVSDVASKAIELVLGAKMRPLK
jgi:hypothetical protein